MLIQTHCWENPKSTTLGRKAKATWVQIPLCYVLCDLAKLRKVSEAQKKIKNENTISSMLTHIPCPLNISEIRCGL